MDDGAAANSIESAVREVLPASAAPWTVTAERGLGGEWTVSLTHEASNGLVLGTSHLAEASAIQSVVELLRDNNEVQRIGQAPKLEHPQGVAGLRTLVQCFGWSRVEVRAVAGLLQDVDALNEAEAEWVASSFGEERPPPRNTRII